MMEQIIDFCDPNDQEKREVFQMQKSQTLYPDSNDFWKFMLHFNMTFKIIVRKSCNAKRHVWAGWGFPLKK